MKHAKIAVINLSGNVGKTTLATNWLKANRPDAKLVSVEHYNASVATQITSAQAQEFSASQFRDIFNELLMSDEVIIDVGASNVIAFMEELSRYKSAVRELDMIVVPTVPAEKQQKDTVKTVEWLSKLGFSNDKIRVVFNMYDGGESQLPPSYVYQLIHDYAASTGKGKATFEPAIVIPFNEVFDLVTNKNIRELAEDRTDWKAKRTEAKQAGDVAALEAAVIAEGDRDLAITAQEALASASDILFGKAAKK